MTQKEAETALERLLEAACRVRSFLDRKVEGEPWVLEMLHERIRETQKLFNAFSPSEAEAKEALENKEAFKRGWELGYSAGRVKE